MHESKTCQACGITGSTVFTVPDGRGDWHRGCWRQYKRTKNSNLAPGRVVGSGKATKRFALDRVAQGYIVVDRKTDAKVCFRKHKGDAVWILRQCREQYMRGFIE
jgi:hypothetical protein